MFNTICLIDIKIIFVPQIWKLWFKIEKDKQTHFNYHAYLI